MQYPGFFALATGAKDSDSPGYAVIQGEKGYIRIEGNPNELPAFDLKLRGSGVTSHYELNRYRHRMVHEFQEFAKIFAVKDYERVKEGLAVSVAVLETAESARKQAGIFFPIDGE